MNIDSALESVCSRHPYAFPIISSTLAGLAFVFVLAMTYGATYLFVLLTTGHSPSLQRWAYLAFVAYFLFGVYKGWGFGMETAREFGWISEGE